MQDQLLDSIDQEDENIGDGQHHEDQDGDMEDDDDVEDDGVLFRAATVISGGGGPPRAGSSATRKLVPTEPPPSFRWQESAVRKCFQIAVESHDLDGAGSDVSSWPRWEPPPTTAEPTLNSRDSPESADGGDDDENDLSGWEPKVLTIAPPRPPPTADDAG